MKRVLSIFVLMCLCIGLVGCSSEKDNSKLTSEELQKYLVNEGYEFTIKDYTTTHYVILTSEIDGEEDVRIQQIDNQYIGPMMTFKKANINEEHANILDKEDNETRLEKEQYDAYIDWLDENGITKIQLQNLLEHYDLNN